MKDDEILQKLRDIRTIVNDGYKNGMHLSAARCRSIVDALDAIRLELYSRGEETEADS
jgi:hypothetical protein